MAGEGVNSYYISFDGEATDICTYGISSMGTRYAEAVVGANPMLVTEIPASATGTIILRKSGGRERHIKSATDTMYAVVGTANNGAFLAVTVVSAGPFVMADETNYGWNADITGGWGITGYVVGPSDDGASSPFPVQENNPFEGIAYYMGQQGFGAAVLDFIQKGQRYTPPTDPFAPGGWSGNGGGTGNFDGTSDTIGEPSLPSLSAINTGFLTLFVPTISQLASLQQYLWGDLISGIADGSLTEVVDSLNKLVANPYDAIMGLSILPVAIPTSGTKDVKMYGVLQSGVQMSYASTQWVTVDCGSLNINEFWGAYLDYSPYTKVTSLYLPYIGTVTLDVDEIMNKTLQVKYHVDVLTGQCVAYIIINGSVEYQYQGECAVSVPVTAQDFSGIVTAGMSLLASGLSFAAGGAAASAATAGLGAGSNASKIATAGAREAGAIAGQAGAVASGVGNVMNMKPNIKAGGPIGGAGGMLAVQKPYLIIIRPRQCVAENQNTYTGYPLNKTMRVGDCSGYTEFSSINLDGIPLTDDEKAELQAIMMGGVYL